MLGARFLARRRWRLALAIVVGVLALSVIGTPAAEASYTVIPECTSSGQTAPCGSGWYTSNVSLSWTWSPQDGGNPTSGCLPHSYAQNTSTTVSCTIEGPSGGGSATQPINLEISSPTATAAPARAPDFNGWYNHPVSASVAGSAFSGIASCTPTSYSGPNSTTATVSGTCLDNAGKSVTATSSQFNYEATGPTVSATPARDPDSNGWYNHALSASVTGSAFSGITSCTPTTYSGPDSTTATVSGTCVDNAGNSTAATSAPFKYEASTPTVTVTPSRGPDSNGWYNHAVAASVSGTSFSGIASCSGTTYSGPDSRTATVNGTCTDDAGKTTVATSAGFLYDASSPLLQVSAAVADRVIVLSWITDDIGPLSTLVISRAPGRRGRAATVVDRRLGTTFRDTGVRNGVKYRYTLVATDQAGNSTTQVIAVRPGPHLLAPAQGAMLTDPPALRWTPVREASYYNVQLFRGRKKILSAWPSRPNLQLAKRWRFGGHRYRLSPGVYHWYVWPGFGPRTEARYGRQLGSSTFTMT